MKTEEFRSELDFLLRGFGDNLKYYVTTRIVNEIQAYVQHSESFEPIEELEHRIIHICTEYLFSPMSHRCYDIVELVDAFVEEWKEEHEG